MGKYMILITYLWIDPGLRDACRCDEKEKENEK